MWNRGIVISERLDVKAVLKKEALAGVSSWYFACIAFCALQKFDDVLLKGGVMLGNYWRQLVESSQLLHINLVLVGDEKLTSDFTFALAKMLCGDVLEHERGLAQIMCVREKEAAMDAVRTCTYLFLIDSTDSLEGIKSRSFSQADFGCPPLLVVVADAAYYDMLPVVCWRTVWEEYSSALDLNHCQSREEHPTMS
uniref:Uncharacterized protein n=1 Tax=Parascaris equorum TaxID=6256 RepID=A0A914RJ65_PAREQ